jgi:hypothetical protein
MARMHLRKFKKKYPKFFCAFEKCKKGKAAWCLKKKLQNNYPE